ncbi:MAG: T9SS type A sorting domain-containing protein [Bacteroidales bacterium]|nr:T9SS type A sorting domain-containing protein [Bacteroidales bacterium]
MKTKIFLSVLAFGLIVSAFGQKPTLELTFTAVDNASYVQLDSIKVMNRTQGGDTVLYWTDTVLVLDYQVGIPEVNKKRAGLQLLQNYPNPVKDQTTITLYLPEKGKVNIVITDMLGRQVINTERLLDRGHHSFRFAPGSGEIFFFTAYWKSTGSSIKILTTGNGSCLTSSLEYMGNDMTEPQLKTMKAIQNFGFNLGDELLYIGYANGLQSGIPDTPETNIDYTFQFATNIPCPGTPTVTYEGQVYNTIQIFSQCWLKENLNVGTMIPGTQVMEDNGVIEKYCYDNDPANCNTYGGMYRWDEMMQYTTTQGVQGICPPDWHILTDEEMKILEGYADSQYVVGDPIWDQSNWRGIDAGVNLKSTNGWNSGGNGTDLYGFSALPGGVYSYQYGFTYLGDQSYFWSSTEFTYEKPWYRTLKFNEEGVKRWVYAKHHGFSVRCVMD